jgi:predicted transcriptional regulator
MTTDLRRRINRLAAAIARAEERCVRDFLVAAVTKLQDSGQAALIDDYLAAVEGAEFAHCPDAWLAERSAVGEPPSVLAPAPAPGAIAVAEHAS